MRDAIRFLSTAVIFFGFSVQIYAERKSVINDPVIPLGPTYGQVVERFCETYVFPDGLDYKAVSVKRDNCIAETVDRDGNNWWIVCRARYSGKFFSVGAVAERARVHYDNGQVKIDLGGLKGAVNTEALANWFKKENPFAPEVVDLRSHDDSGMRRFDAAVEHPNENIYFFSDDRYYRFDVPSDRFDRHCPIGSPGWKGVPADVDAAILHPTQGKVHFFRGDKYYRFQFNGKDGEGIDKVGVIGKDGWHGVWGNGIDAAIVHPKNGMAYFFQNDKYQRFSFEKEGVQGREGTIGKTGWHGVWDDGIDAAVIHRGKAYFFKGNKYRRFNFDTDKVDGRGIVGINGWKEE